MRADRRRAEALTAYIFLAPTLVAFLLFVVGPFIASIGLSAFTWDLFTPPRFAGAENFARLLDDPLVGKTLVNTMVFAVVAESLNVGIGLLIAVGINRMRRRRLGVLVRSAYFLPFIMSSAVVAVLWGFLLQRDFGVLNWVLGHVGVGPISWVGSTTWAMPTVILVDVWKNLGFFVVIFLAGLQSIPRELYEAVRIDGGGDRATFWHVTLPLLSPTIFFAIVVALIGASQVFDSLFVLTNGGPGDSTRSIVMYLYQQAFEAFHLGYASVLAMVVFVIVLVLTIVQIRISRRWVFLR